MEKIEKPWGFERTITNNGRYIFREIVMNEGSKLSLHFHRTKDETIYVMKGSVKILVDNSENPTLETYGEGEIINIPHKTVHRIIALKESVILETSSPEQDDIIRIDDEYGRV